MKPSYYKIIKNLIKKNKLDDIKNIVNRLGTDRFNLVNISGHKLSLLEYSLLNDHFEIFEYLVCFVDIDLYRDEDSLLVYLLGNIEYEKLSAERIYLVLKHTTDVDQTSDGTTALFHAIVNYRYAIGNRDLTVYEQIIIELLNHGADPNFLEGDSNSTLEYIINNNIIKLMELILKYSKFDVSKIIFRAIEEDLYDMVELLINNIDINVKYHELSPLEYAKEEHPDSDIVELLEEHYKK